MKHLKYLATGLILAILSIHSAAQTKESGVQEQAPAIPGIKLLVKTYGDSIRLRWAPETPASWLMLNYTGYRIVRTCYDHPTDTLRKILTPQPLKPLSLEELKKRFGPSDTLAAVAAQMLYGQNFETLMPSNTNPGTGDLVSEIRQASEIQDIRFGMALQAADFSFAVAEAIGLAYTDTDVVPGLSYVYGIEPVLTPGMSKVNSIFMMALNDSLPIPAKAPDKPGLVQKNDRVSIIWPRDVNTAFLIEKSRNGGHSYTPVNQKPYAATIPEPGELEKTSHEAMKMLELLKTHHVYNDKATEGETVIYRLRGITPFGELTPWSDTVGITVASLSLVKSALIRQTETIDNKMVRLSWEYDGDSSLLAGFIVYVSSSPRTGYEPLHEYLLPREMRWYTDSFADRRSFNYYRVMSVGIDGSQAESYAAIGILNDNTPPPPPTGLTGEIYEDGLLEVSWTPSDAPDIRGYKVLHANQPDHNFTPFSGYALPMTLYLEKIPLNTLTRKIYIQVIAQDLAGNLSQPSEILELQRPDVVPPPKPRLLKSSMADGTVSLSWSLSPDPEITGYYLWRKPEQAEQWELLVYKGAEEIKESVIVEDKLPPTGLTYMYTAEAMDKAGNSSGLANPVSFKAPRTLLESVPIDLKVSYNPETVTCRLTWSCNPTGEHHFVIRRGIGEQEPSDYRSANQGTTEFSDNRINPGMVLQYSVYIVYKDGRISTPSNQVKITVP